jgi:hypothetical protein
VAKKSGRKTNKTTLAAAHEKRAKFQEKQNPPRGARFLVPTDHNFDNFCLRRARGAFLSLRNALRDDAFAKVLRTGGLLKRAPVNVFFVGGGVKKWKRRKRNVFLQNAGSHRTFPEKLREAEFILPKNPLLSGIPFFGASPARRADFPPDVCGQYSRRAGETREKMQKTQCFLLVSGRFPRVPPLHPPCVMRMDWPRGPLLFSLLHGRTRHVFCERDATAAVQHAL